MKGNKEMHLRGWIQKCRLGLMFGLAMVMAVPTAMTGYAAKQEKVPVKEMSSLDMAAYVDNLDEDLNLNPEESLDGSTLNGQNPGMDSVDFTTRRLIVLTDTLEQDYGASEILKYEGIDTYLLQYETEAEAEEAYGLILADLGENRCFADKIVPGDALAEWTDARDYPNLDERNAQVVSWGTGFMGMDQLRLNVQTDTKVCVAIIDTGLDVQNPFFTGRTISKNCYNFGNNKKGLKNMFDAPKKGYDPYSGHGTHVAGIIVDATPGNVELLPLRVVFGDSPISQFISAMDYAIQQGADIVNCSFQMGDYGIGYGPLDEVLEKAKKNNVIVVAAAGNNYEQYVTYPGSSAQTVGVSALDTTGKELADYSDWGDTIDFAAPGSDIFSAWDGNRNPDEYIMMSGTSMATPEISAAFAYLKMLYPENTWSKQYKKMKSICRDLKKKGKDIYTGWGVPILSNLLDEVHIHDYLGSPLKNTTHTLTCQTCGFQTKENCMTYRILEDGSIVCRDCGTPVNSRFDNGVMNVALSDQTYISFPGLRSAGAEYSMNHGGSPIELRVEEGYENIPARAFANFPGLSSVILPVSMSNISNFAFCNDPDLTYVDMSKSSVYYLNEMIFMNSGNAQHPMTVLFPKNLNFIGYAAFRGSSIGMLDLSETEISSIDTEAFYDCKSLTRVKFKKTLGWTGASVFENCSSLKETNFEDTGITWMPDRMFRNCSSLTELTIPKEFYSIYSDCFAGCTSLKKINFLGNAPEFYDYEKEFGVFGNDKLTAYYPNNKTWNTIKNNTKKYQFGGKVTWKSYDPNTYIPAISLKLTATAPYNYGEPVIPKFTLKNGKKHVLVEGTDYTITCKNNTEIGQEATATIKGIGDYSGTRTIHYTIVPIPISKVILSETAYPYDGEIHMPMVTVMAGDAVLLENGMEGNDLVELSMKADTSLPGTYTVTAKGLGIYGSSKKVKYKITVCPVEFTKVGAVSKGFKATWKALPEEPITGYQIQYDMDEAVLNKNKGTMVNVENPAAASKKVTGLKGKTTYYVKMRTYLVLGEKTYYSDWTDVKTVTSKK